MYNFELNHLTSQDANERVLQTIEDICEIFQLEDHLGTLSLAIGETVSYLLSLPAAQQNELSLTVNLDNNRLSVQIVTSIDTRRFEEQVKNASEFDDNGTFYMILKLIDAIEFKNEGSEIYLEFDVNPQMVNDEDERVGEMRRQKLRSMVSQKKGFLKP